MIDLDKMTIFDIIEQLNWENGSNYKKEVLGLHKDNELLKRVLKMAADKVTHTYGITLKNVDYDPIKNNETASLSLEKALDILDERFVTRETTGHDAIELLENTLYNLSIDDAYVIERIIDRDLKIRLGRTEINKVFKNLIVKPPYQRCDIGTKKNVEKNIDFSQKVYSQLKMDGTYRSCISDVESVEFMARSGNKDNFPIHEKILSVAPDGYVFIGEMTLMGENQRSKGNGLINSDNPPHEQILYTIWDMVPVAEYKTKNGKSKYEDRFEMLSNFINSLNSEHIQLVPYKIISNMMEAYEHFQEITKSGLEGTVIKAHDMKWKDGTSKQQLKVKLEIDLEVRITGFTKGTGKNADYFGAITFENDEKTIQGKVGVSSMTEAKRNWFHKNRENVIGNVMEVKCNDITKSESNDFHALSHPRFIEMRDNDKDTTDTLERAMELKQMAMELK